MGQCAVAAKIRIPVSIITGFLGSGKTTLLNHLVKQPGMSDTAVIVNEFGEIGLDHLLIEQAFEDTVLLQNGCICCSIRGDLVDTLESLDAQVSRGEIPPYARVIVETTGLADPAPVLQTLMTNERLQTRYTLDGVVATVDAVNGVGQLDEFSESVKQAAIADHLFITKGDLAGQQAIDELTKRLLALNPNAPITLIKHGAADPDSLFGNGPIAAPSRLRRQTPAPHGRDHSHDSSIQTFAIVHKVPLPWDAVRAWLESVASLRGADLLRMKGILNVAGRGGPVIIHGVQHVFHPPVELPKWPNDDRTTRIVFITRNIEKAGLENALSVFIDHEKEAYKTGSSVNP
ncbi:MAG: GTP-binding protein [Opitutaceae bacterium]|nr:GTP-binding protein [Opitutaceae bacterium]